jgi:alpha-tubulin suppressor-like RCC1 family protein
MDNNWALLATSGRVAIRTDGTLWDIKGAPARIGTDNGWVKVAGPSYTSWDPDFDQYLTEQVHYLAIRSDGSLWAKGGNDCGQLGVGEGLDYTAEFIRVGTDNDWSEAETTEYASFAIKTDGSCWAWGGQRNDSGGTSFVFRPAPDPKCGRVRIHVSGNQVGGPGRFELAIRPDGTLWSAGKNVFGNLGNGDVEPGIGTAEYTQLDYRQVGADPDWVDVASGSRHVLARRADGSVWSWGANDAGQLGLGLRASRSLPGRVGNDNDWKEVVATNGDSSLGLKNDGSLWYWGGWEYGGKTITESPKRIGAERWKAVSAYFDGSLFAIRSDGTLWRMIDNPFLPQPMVQVGGETGFVKLTSSARHLLAVKADGSLWGSLIEATGVVPPPVRIGSASWADVAGARTASFPLGIQADGSLWEWGDPLSLVPVRIGMDNDWISASAGGWWSRFALRRDGTIWGWGSNQYYQLGDGTTTWRAAPGRIGTGSDWISISGGFGDTMAIRSDGTLWGWGGYVTGQKLPAQIGSDTGWKGVSIGAEHALALRDDGSLWSWGEGEYGCLGDGSWIKRVPTRVR